MILAAASAAVGDPVVDDQTSRTPAGPVPAIGAPGNSPTAAEPAQPAAEPSAPPIAPSVPPAAPTKPEKPMASVHLRDGRTFSGELVSESNGGCVLRIAGIDTTFEASAIERIRYIESVAVQYTKLRAAIPDGDTEGIAKLSEWLISKGELDLAKVEVTALLKRDGRDARALKLRTDLDRLIDLRDKARQSAAGDLEPGDGQEMSPVEPAAPSTPLARVPTLTPEQINLMKVYEIDLSKPPTVTIPRPAMEQMLDAKQGHPLAPSTREAREAILRAPAIQQLDLMFKLRAREFYPQVKVQGSPEVMRQFADEVMRSWVINACATSECHGGMDAGRLVLSARKPGSDASVYTNFYILDRFRTSDGRSLLDWDEPDRSILLQLGLPREQATVRHPVVKRADGGQGAGDAWHFSLRGPSDRRYKEVVAWMKSMYRPRPDYGLEYQPIRPFEPEAAKPAEKVER